MHLRGIACLSIFFTVSMATSFTSDPFGFSIDFIHKHSLHPPLPTFEGVTDSLLRSFKRVERLSLTSSAKPAAALPQAEMVADDGEYLLKLFIGTPPVEMMAIADTGSDLSWIQCKPCPGCFNPKSPLLDTSNSSTFKPISCTSRTCSAVPGGSCNQTDGTCGYQLMYSDASYSRGDLVSETIALGSNITSAVPFANFTVGCAHLDGGKFSSNGTGVVGLGGGELSLVTQMSSLIKGKFSYCLVPYFSSESTSSKLNFGDNAVVWGEGVLSTPLIRRKSDTFYYLTLEGITVNTERVDADVASPSKEGENESEEGNIIMDSGTTVTFLPRPLFDKFAAAVRKGMTAKPVEGPPGLLHVCYLLEGDSIDIPDITFHFRGADVKLKSINTFAKTSNTSICLAFAPAISYAIYGNMAQKNFLVGFDLEKMIVSFKPSNCTEI